MLGIGQSRYCNDLAQSLPSGGISEGIFRTGTEIKV